MSRMHSLYFKIFAGVFRDAFSLTGTIFAVLALCFTVFDTKNASPVVILLLWLASAVLLAVSICIKRRAGRLLHGGEKITGTVLRVRKSVTKLHLSPTHYADEDAVHPYIVDYRYSYLGKEHDGRSEWLWAKPELHAGDAVELFVDREHPAHSALGEASL